MLIIFQNVLFGSRVLCQCWINLIYCVVWGYYMVKPGFHKVLVVSSSDVCCCLSSVSLQKPGQRHWLPGVARLHPGHAHRCGPLPVAKEGPQPTDDRRVPWQRQEAVQQRRARVSRLCCAVHACVCACVRACVHMRACVCLCVWCYSCLFAINRCTLADKGQGYC